MSSGDDTESSRDTTEQWEVVTQRLYDPETGPDLTTIVIMAVATAEGEAAMDIKEPPLYEAVDIAAVKDALFGSELTDMRGMTSASLEFTYRGHRITIRGDGWVQVSDRTDR